jgi:CheY-like chemotaxis protein
MQSIMTPDKDGILSGLHDAQEKSYFENAQKLPGQFTVFMVDDDADDRALMMKVLQRSPYIYNIRCFESGQELKQHLVEVGYFSNSLLRNIPTLVLLDIHMPGPSGIRVLQDLKSHPLTKDIPVVIATGDVSSEMTSEAYQLKANAYVAKPIHLDQIHEVMYTGYCWPDGKAGQ